MTKTTTKATKKKTASATKRPRKNVLSTADKATRIYGVLAEYERAMHLKSMATKASEDTFVSNYETIEKRLSDEEQATITSIAANPGRPADKREKKALRALRTIFESMLACKPIAASKTKPEKGLSENVKYIHEYFEKYMHAYEMKDLKVNGFYISELWDERANMLIDALPEDLRPRYSDGAKLQAMYEILREACTNMTDAQSFKTVDSDIMGIYQAVEAYGRAYLARADRNTIHLHMLYMFMFCFLEQLSPDELKSILPISRAKKNKGNVSKRQAKIHDDAIASISAQKDVFFKRFDNPSHKGLQTLPRGKNGVWIRNPQDFRSPQDIEDFLYERGITALLTPEGRSIETLDDHDRELIGHLLESDNIPSGYKTAIRNALQIIDTYVQTIDTYQEKYGRLRVLIAKINNTASKGLKA